MRNFQLRYSVFGVKSQSPGISMQNAFFKQNGQYNFTIKDKIQPTSDNIPYTYNPADSSQNMQNNNNNKIPVSKISRNRQFIRYGCLGVGVLGATVGAIYGTVAVKAYTDARDLNSTAQSYKNQNDYPKYAEYDALSRQKTKEYTSSLPAALVGGSLGLLGLTGFTLTFFF
jgi:hypothetical protein